MSKLISIKMVNYNEQNAKFSLEGLSQRVAMSLLCNLGNNQQNTTIGFTLQRTERVVYLHEPIAQKLTTFLDKDTLSLNLETDQFITSCSSPQEDNITTKMMHESMTMHETALWERNMLEIQERGEKPQKRLPSVTQFKNKTARQMPRQYRVNSYPHQQHLHQQFHSLCFSKMPPVVVLH